MNKAIAGAALAAGVALLGISQSAAARDDRLQFPIQDVMSTDDAKSKLGDSVRFYFGKQGHAAPSQKLGEFTSNKKTNFFNKSDQEGCNWAFLSAMIALKERALKEGGNAVIEIRSVYKNEEFSSEAQFECGAGSMMGGVALRGRVVKLP